MTRYLLLMIVGLVVASVWGYFTDLQNGDVGWFVGRLVFVPLCVVGVIRAFESRNPSQHRENP